MIHHPFGRAGHPAALGDGASESAGGRAAIASRLPAVALILSGEQPQGRPRVAFLGLRGRVARVAILGHRTIWLGGRAIVRGLAEQPLPDVLRDGPEPVVLDALPVVAAN